MLTATSILIILYSLHEPCSPAHFHWANKTYLDIVDKMKEDGYFQSNRVRDALKFTDRWFFLKKAQYEMKQQDIGHGATMGAPTTHARVLEALKVNLQTGSQALDVETSGGYLSACMSLMAGYQGAVVATSSKQALTDLSEGNVHRWRNNSNIPPLRGVNSGILFTTGDPYKVKKAHSLYDAIYVRTTQQKTTDYLKPLLKVGGRMAATSTYDDGKIQLKVIDRETETSFKETIIVDEKYPEKAVVTAPPSVPGDSEPGLFDPDYVGYTSIQVKHIPDKNVLSLLCITIMLLTSLF